MNLHLALRQWSFYPQGTHKAAGPPGSMNGCFHNSWQFNHISCQKIIDIDPELLSMFRDVILAIRKDESGLD